MLLEIRALGTVLIVSYSPAQIRRVLTDRKSVVEGKSVDLGGRGIIKKKTSYAASVLTHSRVYITSRCLGVCL